MHTARHIAGAVILSSAFFTGCERTFDPVEYSRAKEAPRSSFTPVKLPSRMTFKELSLSCQNAEAIPTGSKYVAPGTLVEVAAWVYADTTARPVQERPTSISFRIILNEEGPAFAPYPSVQSPDPSQADIIKSPWLHAILHCPLLSRDEHEELKHACSREQVDHVRQAIEEKVMLLSRQVRSGEYSGYSRVVGAFDNGGIFHVVEVERLDVVNP
jgi:hypothetical protein